MTYRLSPEEIAALERIRREKERNTPGMKAYNDSVSRERERKIPGMRCYNDDLRKKEIDTQGTPANREAFSQDRSLQRPGGENRFTLGKRIANLYNTLGVSEREDFLNRIGLDPRRANKFGIGSINAPDLDEVIDAYKETAWDSRTH